MSNTVLGQVIIFAILIIIAWPAAILWLIAIVLYNIFARPGKVERTITGKKDNDET